MILASPTAREKVLAKHLNDLAANTIGVEPFHGECCESELTRLSRIISDKSEWVSEWGSGHAN